MEFSKIRVKRSEIQDLFVKLEEMKGTIQGHYTTLLSKNETSQFFGLDSFRFQVKLMENETKHLKEQMVLIENRLYCDYYKLYVRVLEYLSDTFHFEIPKNPYPLYKDLDPLKVYEFEHTSALFHENVAALQKAYDTLEIELKKGTEDERLNRTGIHIGNYVHNRKFKDTIIQTNLGLYEQYLNTYFNYHMTFLTNLMERLDVFLKQFTREPVPMSEVKNVIVEQVNEQVDPMTEQVIESVIDTMSESVIDPMIDPVVEKVIEQVIDTMSESVIEQVIDTMSESVIESVIDTMSESVIEQVIDTMSESVIESVIDTMSESVIESVIDTMSESVIEPASIDEPVTETASTDEPVAEPAEQVEQVNVPVIDHKSKKKHKKR
jgi:carbon monoxide dehydrogenase subunit G